MLLFLVISHYRAANSVIFFEIHSLCLHIIELMLFVQWNEFKINDLVLLIVVFKCCLILTIVLIFKLLKIRTLANNTLVVDKF